MNAHFERAFQFADEAFAEADLSLKEVKSTATHPRVTLDPGCHTLRFTAHTWHERRRLFHMFLRLAWTALFTGKSKLSFQTKPK